MVSATVPVLSPSSWLAYDAAKKQYAASEANTDAADAQLLVGVASSFYLAAGADEVLTARKHAVEVAAKTAEDAKSKRRFKKSFRPTLAIFLRHKKK